MKVKILKSSMNSYWYSNDVNKEFNVHYNITDRSDPFRHCITTHFIRNEDAVITELPESFCVKRCDDGIKWGKYIQWLNKTYNTDFCGRLFNFDNPYYGVIDDEGWGIKLPFGTEIHIDDMIKHIDYMESQQHINGGEQFYKESQLTYNMRPEFDLTTDEGRLEYSKKYYPIGTKYEPLDCYGNVRKCRSEANAIFKPRIWVDDWDRGIEVSGVGLIYHEKTNRWAEIIKEEKNMETNILELIRLFPELPTDYAKKLVQKALEVKNGCLNDLANFIGSADTPTPFYEYIIGSKSEQKANYVWRKIYDFKNKKTNMETQKLSRQGLKEIHGVACPNWKDVLEHYGSRNPLEDYIELTQEEVDKMFNACTKEQLPIVSKYLNQIDGGINFDKISGTILISNAQELIAKRCFGEYEYKSFYLHREYNWEIRKDSQGELCLIPTKKK